MIQVTLISNNLFGTVHCTCNETKKSVSGLKNVNLDFLQEMYPYKFQFDLKCVIIIKHCRQYCSCKLKAWHINNYVYLSLKLKSGYSCTKSLKKSWQVHVLGCVLPEHGRHSGLMVSALNFRSSSSGCMPWPQTLYSVLGLSPSDSFHPGILMGTGQFNAGGNLVMD